MNTSQPPNKANKPFFLAAAVLVILLAIFVSVEWYGPVPRAGLVLEGRLTETQKSAIGLSIDLSKLFMGWSLAVIGGIGYFLRSNFEKEYPLSRLDLFLCEAVILTSVVSVFYGHLTITFVVTMLTIDVLNLTDPTLTSYIRVQYIAFLSSLLLFGAYIHNTFIQRINLNVPTNSVLTKKDDNDSKI